VFPLFVALLHGLERTSADRPRPGAKTVLRAHRTSQLEARLVVLDVTVDSGIQDCLKPAAGTV
jgi:hypothetical protein